MPEPLIAQAVAHLEAFRRMYSADAIIDRKTNLTAKHLDTVLAHLSRTKEAATTTKRHLSDLIRENEADTDSADTDLLAGRANSPAHDRVAPSRRRRVCQIDPFPPSERTS